MKSFVRLLVAILVIGLAGGTIYYAAKVNEEVNVIQNNQQENAMNSEKQNSEIENTQNEFVNEQPIENLPNENEINNNNESVDINLELEQAKKELEHIVARLNETHQIEETEAVIGRGILGNNIDEYMNSFGMNEISVVVQKVTAPEGMSIIIIPATDMLDTQELIYDQNGNLLLYNSISTSIGGAVHYYFSKGVLLEKVSHFDEEIMPTYENESDILLKANNIYSLFGNITIIKE